MSCKDYVPPVTEQLHGPDPTAGSDCAICVARAALQFASCGQVDASVDKIRKQAGLDKPDPPPDDYSTTIWEYQEAVRAFDERFRELGYEGVKANVTERGRWDDLEPLLKDETKFVCVLVDYGVLNDREPAKSGDPGFGGAHAIGVFGYYSSADTDDGSVKYRIWDSLCDGRRPDVPKGHTFWKAATLRDAADAYAGGGSGTATWCVTPRATLSDPEPEPEPPDPCATARTADANALLNEVKGFLLRGTRGDREARRGLALFIWRNRGVNREGRGITVHQGVTPDDAP